MIKILINLLACLMTRTGFLLKTRPAALIVDGVIFTLVHSFSVSADDRQEVSQNHKHLMCHSRVKFCLRNSNVSGLKRPKCVGFKGLKPVS